MERPSLGSPRSQSFKWCQTRCESRLQYIYIYIYIYAFSRRLYTKRFRLYIIIFFIYFFISMCVPWELNPWPFALLTQCSTTEPQEQYLPQGRVLWIREAPATAPWLRVSRAQWTVLWIYMQTYPLFSRFCLNSLSALNYLSALNCLPALKWPRWSSPCPPRSQCWESRCGVCGWHTPSLNPLPVWIAHPPSLYRLLLSSLLQLRHRCVLAAHPQPEHVSKVERCDAQLNIPFCVCALRSVAHGQSKMLR